MFYVILNMYLIVLKLLCKLASSATVHSENFPRVLFSKMRIFMKINPCTLPFTDIGKSCSSRKFLTLQICLLILFAKIRFLDFF